MFEITKNDQPKEKIFVHLFSKRSGVDRDQIVYDGWMEKFVFFHKFSSSLLKHFFCALSILVLICFDRFLLFLSIFFSKRKNSYYLNCLLNVWNKNFKILFFSLHFANVQCKHHHLQNGNRKLTKFVLVSSFCLIFVRLFLLANKTFPF